MYQKNHKTNYIFDNINLNTVSVYLKAPWISLPDAIVTAISGNDPATNEKTSAFT
jgi:hypothetical protein